MAQPNLQRGHILAWMALPFIVAGCTNNGVTQANSLSRITASPRVNDIYQNRTPEVVRYDRYTLVSTRPADAQRDPLNQMVDITMPAQMVRSVGDGFRYLLLESGYSLCPVSSSIFAELLSRPLPAVQRSIGPVRLSEALQILAGPAWRLRVDEVNREVCFTLRDVYRDLSTARQVTAPVLANNIGSNPGINHQPKLSGDPFSASSSLQNVVPVKAALKPESLPVPSPTIVAAKSVQSKPVPTKNSGSLLSHKPAENVFSQSLPQPLEKAVPAVIQQKPTTAILPAATVVHTPSVKTTSDTNKPVFTTGQPIAVVASGLAWRAEVGSTLKETLTRWAGEAKCENGGSWVVIWPVTLDYRIDATLVFNGNFESVLVQVFDLYRQADKPLYASASRLQCLVSVSDQPGRS